MYKLLFLSFLSLNLMIGCAQRIEFQPQDRIVMVEDNSSIQDYEARTYCELTFSQVTSPKVAKLMNKLNGRNIEIADGSTYLVLTVYAGSSDKVKFSQTIDWGTRDKQAAALLELLAGDCGK